MKLRKGGEHVKKMWKKAVGSQVARYLFFGGCTTCVNLGIFTILHYLAGMGTNPANLLSIIISIFFAFWVNRRFVFQKAQEGTRQITEEFVNFTGMRFVTMLIEFWGVVLLAGPLKVPALVSKVTIQIVVILLNYIISKFFVFREKEVSL
ncbi:GtrA family protein [Roseburia hominis]